MKRIFCMVAFAIFAFALVSCDDSEEGDSVSLSSISVTAKPETLYYCLGDEFDATGLAVTASYSDGSSKDVSDLVEISGFDSSAKKENVPITLSYTDGGVSRTATLSVTVTDYPVAKSRVVKVSFQYYKRESDFDDSEDAFKPYAYSDDAADDVNGSVTFYINEKGMRYSVEDVIYAFMYYPSNRKDGVPSSTIRTDNVKPTKYFSENETTTVTVSELWHCDSLCVPFSYLYTSLADNLIPYTYGTNKRFSPDPIDDIAGKARTLNFEDYLLHGGLIGRFNGEEYPAYERDEQGNITKGTIVKFVNAFYRCMLTVETDVQDVHISWPPNSWAIDH